jgi:competence protein ComEC
MYTDIKADKHPALLAAAQRGTKPVWLKAGDRVAVSETSAFQVLGPITFDELSENNNSLVMVLVTPHGNMLLAGDMEFAEEKAVMAAKNIPKCAVLKVSHHGEDDSTSPEFARLVSPQVAVISTNSVEEPDTPYPTVIAALGQAGAKIVVTQEAKGGVKVTLRDGNASAELVDFENLPGMNKAVRLAGLDHEEDVLTISNTGRETVSLAGWYVFSVKGEEIFFFPEGAQIAPGASVRLGSEKTDSDCDWRFPDKNVWSDKKKDEAVLYDEYGRVVSRLGNGLTEE